MDVTTIVAGGALSALLTKMLDRNTAPGINLSAPGPNPSTTQTVFHSPHVKPGAKLLTDEQIADANVPAAMKNQPQDAKRWKDGCLQKLQVERFGDSDLPQACKGVPYSGPPMALTALKDGSLALGAAASTGIGSAAGAFHTGALALTGAASTAFAAATFGIGAAIAVYSIISAHHAAAVKREQALECQLIPPLNESLRVIENAVNGRIISPQQGQQALDQLHTDFVRAATGGPGGLEEKNPSGHCNALCWTAHVLQAICVKKQNRYAQLI